jgi:hypothetical protein
MALMAAKGEIEPMPLAAIFADTQAEPASVYRWLDWLEGQLPFPVYRVTNGSLAADSTRLRTSKRGHVYVRTTVPAFVAFDSGSDGMLWRKCTQEFKLVPLRRKVRELMRAHGAKAVVQWVGISLDEAHRMKDAREKYLETRWPLIEAKMRRSDCLLWMQRHGYPMPPRSACTFCPYHSDAEWQRLRTAEPEGFAQAVQFERDLQAAAAAQCETTKSVPWLHRSMRPLDTVEFTDSRQIDMFGNECEGMCGV